MAGLEGKASYEELLRGNEELGRQLAEERLQNEQLRRDNQSLTAQVEDLKRRLADLQRRFDDLERTAYRQAAPFRVPEKRRKSHPSPDTRPAGGLCRSR